MRPADNPFRAQRIDALAFRIERTRWSRALERFEKERWAGAVVGPHGHGKSTALRRLHEHLESEGRTVRYLRADREPTLRRLLRGAEPESVFLLDGVERLGLFARRSLQARVRRHGGVVVTLHQAGLLPTCLRCRTSVALLEALVEELTLDVAPRARQLLPELFARHRGNLRRCLFELYDRWPDLSDASAQAVHRAEEEEREQTDRSRCDPVRHQRGGRVEATGEQPGLAVADRHRGEEDE